MNPKLQLARETMKRLRARRCVQRVVVLRLTVSEAKRLSEILAATIRECGRHRHKQTNHPAVR